MPVNRHEEHKRIRSLLQKLDPHYTYTEPVLPDEDRPYEPILTVVERPVRVARTTPTKAPTAPAAVAPVEAPPPEPSNRPSALDLLLNAPPSGPEPPLPAPPPAPDPPPDPPPEPLAAKSMRKPTLSERLGAATSSPAPLPDPPARPDATAIPESPARSLLQELEARGFDVFAAGDKLRFKMREDQSLTDEDRARIMALKPELLKIAPPWPEPEKRTLVQFLGMPAPERPTEWVPKEPPNLENTRDIIINFETDGVDVMKSRPVGVTVGSLDGQVKQYLPFAHRGGGNLDEGAVIRYLQSLRNKRITNANTRFEVHMGKNIGVDFEEQGCEVSDVMHYAALLDDHRKRFAIDVLAEDYLGGVKVPRIDESRMADYHASEVAARAEYQAQLVSELTALMWPQLDEQDLQKVRQLEDDVIYPVVEMERNGSLINMELNEEYYNECNRRHDDLVKEVSTELGFAFDHTASGWQRTLEKLGFKIPDSYDEESLSTFDHPLVRKGQLAAAYASLNSKTFAAYRRLCEDGVLRYDINQLRGEKGGTVSGRFSIGYIQQVPNHDNHAAVFGEELYPRRLFHAANGVPYLEADAAQIEYRIFAHFAENPKVLAAYAKEMIDDEDTWLSFHKFTWNMMLQFKPDLLYSHMKNFNFATLYGAKLLKLAVMMGFITKREADQIRRAKTVGTDPRLDTIREIEKIYRQVMPEVNTLLDYAQHLAKSKCDEYCRKFDKWHKNNTPHRGFVRTLLGRRSRFPHNDRAYRGLNRVIQGTGADIMKRKMVELHRARKYTGLLMRMTVHDAVGGDAQEGAETLKRVREVVNAQSFPELKVKILWNAGIGQTWADCK